MQCPNKNTITIVSNFIVFYWNENRKRISVKSIATKEFGIDQIVFENCICIVYKSI